MALRRNVNIVFVGHVDAGKSTIAGRILYVSGQIDERAIERQKKESKDLNRESWLFAYTFDTDKEEREKGITVEYGKASFSTQKTKYTIIDTPGHKSFVPSMIEGASQADIAILVVSARTGEFETGFERGGQTREHTMIIRNYGVRYIIVAINKMDDESVNWSKERYDEIVSKIGRFLKMCKFEDSDVFFVPISGLSGQNIAQRHTACSWFSGASLFEILDGIDIKRTEGDVIMPILSKERDGGVVVEGKLYSGVLTQGSTLYLFPASVPIEVTGIYIDGESVDVAYCNEQPKLRIRGVEEESLSVGNIITSNPTILTASNKVRVKIQLMNLSTVFLTGYKAIMHVGPANVEVRTSKIETVDGKRGAINVGRNGSVIECILDLQETLCIFTFNQSPTLGAFVLRNEGTTIAVGKILEAL